MDIRTRSHKDWGLGIAELEKQGMDDGRRKADDGGQFSEDGRQMTDDGRNRRIQLAFYCRTPGLDEEPVVLSVSYGGRVLDQIVFLGKPDKKKPGQTVRREYELPVVPGKEWLLLEVSRMWISHEHLKNFDRRKLGVGVKVLKF